MSQLRPHFYRALHNDGRLSHGRLPAHDRQDLEQLLAEQAATLLFACPMPWPEPRLNSLQVTELCFQWEQLLGAGLPLLETIEICRSESASRQLKGILQRLGHDLRHGLTLSQALQLQSRHFDPGLIAGIRAAEYSGDLAEACASQYRYRRWLEQFRQQLRQNLSGPLLSGLVCLAACGFLILHTAPQLQQFAYRQGTALPASTTWLLHALAWLQTPTPWLLLGCILLPGAILLLRLDTLRRPLHRKLLDLPLLGPLWLHFELARFCRTLGLLYVAGLPLLAALSISRDVLRNAHLRSTCAHAIEKISSGQSLSIAFANRSAPSFSSPFPTLFLRLLAIGEQAGRLGESLHTLAEHFTLHTQARMQQLQDLLPPLLTMLLGLVLIATTWSVISPLQQLLVSGGGLR